MFDTYIIFTSHELFLLSFFSLATENNKELWYIVYF